MVEGAYCQKCGSFYRMSILGCPECAAEASGEKADLEPQEAQVEPECKGGSPGSLIGVLAGAAFLWFNYDKIVAAGGLASGGGLIYLIGAIFLGLGTASLQGR